LRYEIQDEINMMTVRRVEDANLIALKEEENLARKKWQRSRGRSLNRGKVIVHDKEEKPKVETGKQHNLPKRGGSS
jgi:hypothetical protein